MSAGAGRVVRRAARAKLNLSLRVLSREESGYHQIETMFCLLELADEVEVSEASAGVELQVRSAGDDAARAAGYAAGAVDALGPVESNLAWRAASLFRDVAGTPGVRVTLHKRIPHGAGLGGGSSDAAAVLLGTNALHGDVLGRSALLDMGARLGSDVPFFLADVPLALAWGRGERLLPLPPLPRAPVLLAVPPERFATADAYAALAQRRAAAPRAPAPAVLSAPTRWSELAALCVNDFEDVAFERLPRAQAAHRAIAASGAMMARLTGSGSVVYGVYDEATLAAAEPALRRAVPDVALIRSWTVGGP